MSVEKKTCSKCGTTKQLSEFRLRKLKSGDIVPTSWCRSCLNSASKLCMREHLKDPEVRERAREKDRRRYHEVIKADPERFAAENARKLEWSRRPEVRAKTIQTSKKWAKENPGRVLKNKRRWNEENRDKSKVYQRKYHVSEKGNLSLRLNGHRRRARERNAAIGKFGKEEWLALVAAFDGCCAYCGAKPPKLTADHVVALARGGSHSKENIVPACRKCNDRKNAKTLDLFYERFKLDRAASEARIALARKRLAAG